MSSSSSSDLTLSVSDVHKMWTIVNVCQKRGAFQVDEMQIVGTLAQKLHAILEQHQKQEAGESPSPEESSNPEVPASTSTPSEEEKQD